MRRLIKLLLGGDQHNLHPHSIGQSKSTVGPAVRGVEICNSRLEATGVIIPSTSGIKRINMGHVCTRKFVEAISLGIAKTVMVRKRRNLTRGALQVSEVQTNQTNQKKSLQ